MNGLMNKCATARRNFHSARNFFQRHPSGANRHSYISANETISKYFENVLGADPPELSEEVLNLINNDHFEMVDVDALDSEITEDDIIKAIAKLEPEKSAGSDNIIGEIFTASPIFFAALLKKLFNYTLTFGLNV